MLDLTTLEKCFIIAEIGSNHNKNLTLAKEMIIAAKESGADAVKFQSINIKELYYNPSEKIQQLHRKIDLIENWHYELNKFSQSNNITFFSAPTYLKAIDILEDAGVNLYKLASAQVATFPQLINKVAKMQKPTMLSTGISSYSDIENAVQIFKKYNNYNFAILHCNSLYPTPYDKANLRMIEVYQKLFQTTVGYSDHTEDIFASLSAVTLGAKIIERHFTTDKTIPVPDTSISILPEQFATMTKGIRAVESALSYKPRDTIEKDEATFKHEVLYRLVLSKDKKINDPFKESDFCFMRHSAGIDCRDLDLVLKHTVSNADIRKGTLLTWEHIKGRSQ